MRVSALLRHGGDTKNLLKSIAHGIPVHHLHQTCYTQSVSLHCRYFRLCDMANITRCRVRMGTAMG